VRIAREGIYGLKQFLRDVLDPILEFWDVEHLAGLSTEAEKARQDLSEFVAKWAKALSAWPKRPPPPATAATPPAALT